MGDLGAEPRLVVPEGMMIDDSSRERLARLLAAAPESVSGVAAATGDLVPGASYRVHAEWMSLCPPSAGESGGAETVTSVAGAALLRPNVGFEVQGGLVTIATGELLLDSGAHVHDPYRPIGALQSASEKGRPPFPRRPVVVFLGCEDRGRAEWVRRLVNRLVRRDVEARIATADVAGGLHLTRPVRPDEASIRALAPDVVVTLDPTAARLIDGWSDGDRSTVVVEFDAELTEASRLVSWQIDRAAGRLRARIGPRIDAPAFAALVGRLCAGPHPVPPPDRPEASGTRIAVRERWANHAAEGAGLGCMVVTGALDAAGTARVDGLLDHLAAASVLVGRAKAASAASAEARRAAVVLLAGVGTESAVNELVAVRRREGLATVVDLGAHDVEAVPVSGRPRLTGAAATLAAACGLAIAPPGAVHAAARRAGVRTLALPTLIPRTLGAALQEARSRFDPKAPRVIGWHVGRDGTAAPGYRAVVAQTVSKFLTEHPDVRLELVGDAARAPIAKRAHQHVSILTEAQLDPKALARWTVHVWTPELMGGEVADDARVFELASAAGVPSIMAVASRRAVDGYVSPSVLARAEDDPDEWERVLRHVLVGVERRANRSYEAFRRADTVNGLAASRAVATRFVGWATFRPIAEVGA